ncbi:zinc finger MYND domain-containing protein 10-like isoform 2, partial [Planoprotostelium fungivorum]
ESLFRSCIAQRENEEIAKMMKANLSMAKSSYLCMRGALQFFNHFQERNPITNGFVDLCVRLLSLLRGDFCVPNRMQFDTSSLESLVWQTLQNINQRHTKDMMQYMKILMHTRKSPESSYFVLEFSQRCSKHEEGVEEKEEMESFHLKFECGSCGTPNPTKKCSRCQSVGYCSRECQVKDWPNHKGQCTKEETFTLLKEEQSLVCVVKMNYK